MYTSASDKKFYAVCSQTTTSDGPHYDHAYQDTGWL